MPEISHNDGVCYSVLLNAAYFHFGQRHFDRAIEYYQRALAIARKTGNKNNEAEVLKSLALAYFESGHGEKAIELMDAAVQIYDNLGSPLAKKAREQLDYLHKRVSKKWWQFWV